MDSSECENPESPLSGPPQPISDLLAPAFVRLELRSRDREGVIKELLELLGRSGRVPDREGAYRAVMARESLVSTGVGRNIAIPHALVPGLTEVQIALGMSSIGVDFAASDDLPAHIVFLLLFPEEATTTRIQLLAQLSRLLRHKDLFSQLMNAQSSDAALAVLREAERAIGQQQEEE